MKIYCKLISGEKMKNYSVLVLTTILSLLIVGCGGGDNLKPSAPAADTTAPTITLIGDSNMTLTVGDTYQEPGSTVTDDRNNNLSATASGTVDTSTPGTYTVTYSVSDSAGNAATPATRTVVVEAAPDTEAPVITLIGGATINVVVGDAYVEQGASVTDNVDTGLSATPSGSVDTSTIGTYTVTYTATDLATNESTITRTIIVADMVAPLTNAFIFDSVNDDTFFMEYWGNTFGTGTQYTDQPTDTTYAKALEITKSDSWGTVVAWGNEPANSIDISAYTHARFKVKTDTFTQVDVRVLRTTSGNEVVYNLTSGTDLGNGWVEMQVPLPSFTNMTWFALNFIGDAGTTVLLADVYFTTLDSVPVTGPAVGAPLPPSYANNEVVVLYSDSLTQDSFIGVWDANWYQAPVYAEGNVEGNNFAKYQITAGGIDGGVVGLEFGFENGSLDVSTKTTWNLDLYVESGITKISLQLASTDGSATYVIDSPTTGEWKSYPIPFDGLSNNDGTGKNVLAAGVLQAIGIQLYGTAGQSVYADNIYFSGDSSFYNLAVSVTDDNNAPLPNATVSVGNVNATTNSSGVATLNLQEAAHKVFVDVDGFGVGQGNQTIAGGDTTLSMSVNPLSDGPTTAAPAPTDSNDDAYVLYSNALLVDRFISFWSDPWFQPPTFSEVTIEGDKTAKLQIIPGGVSGGITGIQYGVQGGPIDVSTSTGLRFDMYATSGITQVGFQIVSTVGPAVTPFEAVVTGQWITIEIPFADYPTNFNPESLTQLGVQLWGTTSDAVYIDNIYFYK
jgi:hypothetical protein